MYQALFFFPLEPKKRKKKKKKKKKNAWSQVSESPTLPYNWTLTKVPLSVGASPIGHYREYPLGFIRCTLKSANEKKKETGVQTDRLTSWIKGNPGLPYTTTYGTLSPTLGSDRRSSLSMRLGKKNTKQKNYYLMITPGSPGQGHINE